MDMMQKKDGKWVEAEPIQFQYPKWVEVIPFEPLKEFVKKWIWEHGEDYGL